jgi:hypothetical protein
VLLAPGASNGWTTAVRATCPICREPIEAPPAHALDVDVVHADADHRTQVIVTFRDVGSGGIALAHVCAAQLVSRGAPPVLA